MWFLGKELGGTTFRARVRTYSGVTVSDCPGKVAKCGCVREWEGAVTGCRGSWVMGSGLHGD